MSAAHLNAQMPLEPIPQQDVNKVLVSEMIKDSPLTSIAFVNLTIFTAVLFSAAGLYIYTVMAYVFLAFITFGLTAGIARLIPQSPNRSQLIMLMLLVPINDCALASILIFDFHAPEHASLSAAISIVISMAFISVILSARYFLAFSLSRIFIVVLSGVYVYFSLMSPGGLTEYIAMLTIALLIMLIIGYWLIIQKSTQIKLRLRLEEAQKRSNADYDLRKRLISYVGHDLRQPVHALDYILLELERRESETDELAMLGDARECVSSASRMIEDVVQISHFDSAKIDVRNDLIDVNSVLQTLVREYEKPTVIAGTHLRYIPTTLEIEFDRGLLMRILRNLLKNAIKYARSDRIVLGVRHRPDQYEIWVIDNGCGMDIAAEMLAENTAQNNKETNSKNAGLGLGLKISTRLARACGAQLSIQSNLNQGTNCRLILPKQE